MPRIDHAFLDCAVYLYPNEKAARSGISYGGSGFLVAVPYELDIDGVRRSHVYAVPNSHVVRESRSPVIRLNKLEGQTEVLPLTYKDWIDDWDEDDLAVCMLDDTIMNRFRWFAPTPSSFLRDDLLNGIVGVGTDVITIARFIAHDGKQENFPVALFGNISMLNWEAIRRPDRENLKQESFLVQSKAFPGTSGSPVFLAPLEPGMVNMLVGIVWGYSYLRAEIRRKNPDKPIRESSMYINDNTGMMLVIPAWKLQRFLDRSDLVMQRKKIEQEAM